MRYRFFTQPPLIQDKKEGTESRPIRPPVPTRTTALPDPGHRQVLVLFAVFLSVMVHLIVPGGV